MSGVITSCRLWRSSPFSRNAVFPHSFEAVSRVSVSVIPGSQTFTPQVSITARAPSAFQRVRSCASPCTTGMIWMPLPPESASQDGSGTGQTCTISSRAMSSGGSRRPPGDAWPIRAAT